jgi:hypothetical protein
VSFPRIGLKHKDATLSSGVTLYPSFFFIILLERAKSSWRAAEQLSIDELVGTNDLFERLISEVCSTLEGLWKKALDVVTSEPFHQKMVSVTGLSECSPPTTFVQASEWVQPSGSFSSAGNTAFSLPSASSDYYRPSSGVRKRD